MRCGCPEDRGVRARVLACHVQRVRAQPTAGTTACVALARGHRSASGSLQGHRARCTVGMDSPSQVINDAAQTVPDACDNLVHVGGRTAPGRADPVDRAGVAHVQLDAGVTIGHVHSPMLCRAMGHASRGGSNRGRSNVHYRPLAGWRAWLLRPGVLVGAIVTLQWRPALASPGPGGARRRPRGR